MKNELFVEKNKQATAQQHKCDREKGKSQTTDI